MAKEALRQATQVQNAGFPAILTLRHLAWHVDTSYSYLRRIIARQIDPYRVFRVTKRNGSWRTICVPDNDLLRVQKWLNKFVLKECSTHPNSYAYAPGSSPLACARKHLGCKWLIKVDVRQFFESISEIQVFQVFNGLGYEPLISFELARLTTRLYKRTNVRYKLSQWSVSQPFHYKIRSYSNPFIGHLPQGAPTSPMLSNLAVKKLDDALVALGDKKEIVYTRYSDDLFFSAAQEFSRNKATKLIQEIYQILLIHGLRPHKAKTTISPPGARKVILGLIVDGDKPRLSRAYKSRVENHIRGAKIFGPTKHSEHYGFRSVVGFKYHLDGLIRHAASVDKDFATRMGTLFASVQWPL